MCFHVKGGKIVIHILTGFFKWIFADHGNDLAILFAAPIAYLVARFVIGQVEFHSMIQGVLLLIPIIFSIGIIFRLLEWIIRKALRQHNKEIGSGYVIITFFIIGFIEAFH